MNKRAFSWIIIGFFVSNSTAASAFEHCGSSTWTTKSSRYSYSQDLGRMHGYYPKELTEGITQRYSYTPEEAGHYILGRSDSMYRYLPTFTDPAQRTEVDPTRVLVSPSRIVYIPETRTISNNTDRPPRINDSLDLSDVIEQHKWVIPVFNN